MGSVNSPCPLDVEFSSQISALLSSPSLQSQNDYYDELIEKRKCHGIRIKHNHKFGKGVFANIGFKEGELILKDDMLVAAQHSSNKVDCLVCSHCYCFIGSVEYQIGRKLYLQNVGTSPRDTCDNETNVTMSTSSNDLTCNSISEEVLASLMNGDLLLPYSEKISLPQVYACPGGCKEEQYCGKECAESDWEMFHSLLCTGEAVESSRQDALREFVDHANGTNDIFIVAAKAISSTILRYKKLKSQQSNDKKKKSCTDCTDGSNFSLLLEAWKPFAMGFKRRWWDCIALPDDVHSCDELSFRMDIRDMTFDSLQLLRDAIFDRECAPLFSLEIYGNIIGMFELNNLNLVVASPVEDYFIYIDDLEVQEKEKAKESTKPFLDALGDGYSISCEGSAFYPLQSCMNHSCCPSAKAFKRDEDKDGQAVIIANRPITAGEEITISYIDEDLPFEERQAQLADYGFRCSCQRCLKEQP